MISGLFLNSFGKMAAVALVLAGLCFCAGCASTPANEAVAARSAASMARDVVDRSKRTGMSGAERVEIAPFEDRAREAGEAADAAVERYNGALDALAKAKKTGNKAEVAAAQKEVNDAAADLRPKASAAYNAADDLEGKLSPATDEHGMPVEAHAKGQDLDGVIRILSGHGPPLNPAREPGDPYDP